MPKSETADDTGVTPGSGNVFADLGLANAEELQLKTRLTLLIARIVEERDWSQQRTADVLGIKQPDVSELLRGRRLEHYSVERLLRFLARLEQRVTITVRGETDDGPVEEIAIAAAFPRGRTT